MGERAPLLAAPPPALETPDSRCGLQVVSTATAQTAASGGSPPPPVCATGARGIRGRVRKGGEARVPLSREERHDGAGRRRFAASASQSAPSGAAERGLCASSRTDRAEPRGARCAVRRSSGLPSVTDLDDSASPKPPAAHRRLGRAVFPTPHHDGRVSAAGGANLRRWGGDGCAARAGLIVRGRDVHARRRRRPVR